MASPRDGCPQAPLHPGGMLRDQVLPGLGLSVSQAARELRIARQTLHRVLAGTAAVSPEMATRLARLSGTAPRLWLDLQQRYDLWHAEQALAGVLTMIPSHILPPAIQAEIGLLHDRSIQARPQSEDRGRGPR
ncbi:HigA family addiction module antidote protein [Microvirga sp. HBU67558]|uniref:HigA family addiction module antitoxin n=1 Tax=Microvirga TaxID=186650 RepID=UPI001B369A21|nr:MULTISPECIES: HigA family addiction module antitoxin [unclassified Microvirga]MBQ0824499.1 HigA family addiction module antidote protein [Microvirga sp. HBU67558]